MKKLISAIFLFLSLPTFSQTYSGAIGPISDDGLANDFLLNVSGLTPSTLNGTHGLIGVCIDITHTWDSDLNIDLIAPDGTSITLLAYVGGVTIILPIPVSVKVPPHPLYPAPLLSPVHLNR
ncbi:MAG: proprotein convertase P-domain-containing protein [Bacteroidetes bacterium]|nr:proprotein convertase P-domain-containing protein [Bacteroidota bacterium]